MISILKAPDQKLGRAWLPERSSAFMVYVTATAKTDFDGFEVPMTTNLRWPARCGILAILVSSTSATSVSANTFRWANEFRLGRDDEQGMERGTQDDAGRRI